MCEATQQLKRISYELRIQRGNGVIDLGLLERMASEPCAEHGETA
jgi:hypothetical protein